MFDSTRVSLSPSNHFGLGLVEKMQGRGNLLSGSIDNWSGYCRLPFLRTIIQPECFTGLRRGGRSVMRLAIFRGIRLCHHSHDVLDGFRAYHDMYAVGAFRPKKIAAPG